MNTSLPFLARLLRALAAWPERAAQRLITGLARLFYRVEVHGAEHLPREGGALLLSNHVCYSDAVLIQCATRRPIRYLMSRTIFRTWVWCRPIFRLTGSIPVDPADAPRPLARALASAREVLRQGGLVGVFPEGELTRTGELQAFRRGFEAIIRNTGCPIVPVHLDGLWGSIFSFRQGAPGWRLPRRLPYPVTIRFGKPLAPSATPGEVREAVSVLAAESAAARAAQPGNTLGCRLLRQARRAWFRSLACDTLGQRASSGRFLIGAAALGRRLAPRLGAEPRVGVLLPPCVAAATANAALTLQGRTVVNLNWTVSAEAFASAVAQSGLAHIVTSRRFVERLSLPPTAATFLYAEELLAGLTLTERLRAAADALFRSPSSFAAGRAPQPSDAACVIFSSGSTGVPKGVVLSHANLLANLDALCELLPLGRADTLCAALPFFHSFGYLGTLWWPLLGGLRVAYHVNPLQTDRVLRLVRDERATALLTTPTLLHAYAARAEPGDLASLRHVFTGGERLPAALADAFERRFGLRPLEGYGATELAPVVAVSLPDRRAGETLCVSRKPGSAGRALPNLALRVVDPQTRERLPPGAPGLLLVKGPSVMQGYLNDPARTAEVLRDGWYDTGDVARIDEDGFLFLTDRLARFSKIGGEMVPHGAVEEALQSACGTAEPCVAVVSAEDAAQGERLVVCYTERAGEPDALHQALRRSGLPNLWLPRRANFLKIPALPVLGTGKTDLRALRALAQQSLCAS